MSNVGTFVLKHLFLKTFWLVRLNPFVLFSNQVSNFNIVSTFDVPDYEMKCILVFFKEKMLGRHTINFWTLLKLKHDELKLNKKTIYNTVQLQCICFAAKAFFDWKTWIHDCEDPASSIFELAQLNRKIQPIVVEGVRFNHT